MFLSRIRWDEWIPPGRMRKDGEEVKKEAADLKIALKAKPKKAGGVKRKREAAEGNHHLFPVLCVHIISRFCSFQANKESRPYD